MLKNIVLLNSAFAYVHQVKTIQEGFINSGSALNKLNELIRISSALKMII